MPRTTSNFNCCNNNTKTTWKQLQSAKGLKSKYFTEPKIEKKSVNRKQNLIGMILCKKKKYR